MYQIIPKTNCETVKTLGWEFLQIGKLLSSI